MGDFLKLIAIYLILMAVLVIVSRLISKLIHDRRRRQYPDYDRQLTNRETDWIDQLDQRFIARMRGLKRGRIVSGLLFSVLVIMLLVLFGYMLGLHLFRIPKIDGALMLQGEPYSVVASIFLGAALSILPFMIAAKLGRKNMKAHFSLGYSFDYKAAENPWGARDFQWKRLIEHHVRRWSFSTLEPTEKFDLEGFITRRFAKFWYVYVRILAVLFAASIILFFLERHNFSLIHKDHIELSPFTSVSTKTYTRNDIVSIDRACNIRTPSDKNKEPRARLTYKINFHDGQSVTIINQHEIFIKKKTGWAYYWQRRIDPNLLSPVIVKTDKNTAPTQKTCRCAIMDPSSRRAKYADHIATLYGLRAIRNGCEY